MNEDTGKTMRTTAYIKNTDAAKSVVMKAEVGEDWYCSENGCYEPAVVTYYTPLDTVITPNGMRMRLMVLACSQRQHQKFGVDAVVSRITGTHKAERIGANDDDRLTNKGGVAGLEID